MEPRRYDRAAEDLGNIVNLGHVNYRIPDQRLAMQFYVCGLGLTRDPVLMQAGDNMWVNAGASQFHLPTGAAVTAPGIVTGLVLPELDALRERLGRVGKPLAGTLFEVRDRDTFVEAVCPWGNRVRCHAPDAAKFGPIVLGMAYVEFETPIGVAAKIARFYREVFGALTRIEDVREGKMALVRVGDAQELRFIEREHPAPACADHHLQIYLADFAAPYHRLQKAGARIEESGQHQYRIFSILDVETGEPIFTADHEVRSMTHPMYNRPLFNRDASLSARNYRAGRDLLNWRMQ